MKQLDGLGLGMANSRFLVRGLLVTALVIPGLGATAHGQERSYAEEPTGGINLPAVGLAGDQDASSVVVNPAGLLFLSGTELGLALDVADEDDATGSGPGFGFYFGSVLGGRVLPRLGWGVGIEAPRPSRLSLAPDPGTPTRLTLSTAMALGSSASFGVGWHRFFDDDGRALSGLSSWDLGLSARFGPHAAAGFVVRDVDTPTVAGLRTQRRYELEITARPLATDRLELALGGRLGETRTDFDGWFRWSARVMDGLFFKGQFDARELSVIERSPAGAIANFDEREYRLTAGLEVSLGGFGVATYASGVLNADGDGRFGSGTVMLRLSERPPRSIVGPPRRIERIALSGGMNQKRHTLLISHLQRIVRDPAVVAVLVQFDGVALGWASAHEVREQLLAIRAAGKKVFSYMVGASTRDYFIASASDRVYMDPAGQLQLSGMSATVIYFKGLFDKLGVNAQFEKIEEYKSAPEAFTRTGPSATASHMRGALYDSLFDTLVDEIAKSRGLTAAKVRQLVDEGAFTPDQLARDHSLIDAVLLPKELGKEIATQLGGVYPIGSAPRERRRRWSYPKIAVIYIEGDIVDGKSKQLPVLGRRMVGSVDITRAIARARADANVAAIVLRIDSPGGSALASEMIAREVFATRGVKPIICSMGDVAASGGYFAAAGCDHIFADRMTITGSIGIFFGKFDLSALASRLGLTWSSYTRGKHANATSIFRPLTDEERVVMKERLRYFYNRFVTYVADGRGMTTDEVDAVGRGHVWTGAAATPIKLVDELGGVADAIRLAKLRAGIGDRDATQLVLLPRDGKSLLQQLTGLPTGRAATFSPLALIPGGARLLEALPGSLLAEPQTMQARLPFDVVW